MTLLEIQQNKPALINEANAKANEIIEHIELMQRMFPDYKPPFTITRNSPTPVGTPGERLKHGVIETVLMTALATDITKRLFRKDFVSLAEQNNININSLEQTVKRLVAAKKLKKHELEQDGYKASYTKV